MQNNALKDRIKYHFECIEKVIGERGNIPVKPMAEYTVDDIVKMRTGYELIQGELDELKAELELED